METITNAASSAVDTASKLLWGEQGQQTATTTSIETATTTGNETAGKEPISGETGKGTVDSPYDQGNSDDATNPTRASTTTTSELPDRTRTDPTEAMAETYPTPPSNPTDASTSDAHGPRKNTDKTYPTLSDNPIKVDTTKDTDKTHSTTSNNPINASTGGAPEPLKDTDKTGVTGGVTGGAPTKSSFSESNPNPGAAPSSGAAPGIEHQGADKATIAPNAPKDNELKEQTLGADELLKKRDPNDHSGEPMKMHGATDKTEGGIGGVPATQEERRESKVGNPGGQEHGKEPKGTGEQYVKTTGMQSEGGDFDATKPGAGREADRIMEEKGIKKTEGQKDLPATPEASNTTTTGGSPSSPGGEEKVSKMTKLKEKLHIGHKDKS